MTKLLGGNTVALDFFLSVQTSKTLTGLSAHPERKKRVLLGVCELRDSLLAASPDIPFEPSAYATCTH